MAIFRILRVPSLRGRMWKSFVEAIVETANSLPVEATVTEVMDSSPVRTTFATSLLPCVAWGSGVGRVRTSSIRCLGIAQILISWSHQLITSRFLGTLNRDGC